MLLTNLGWLASEQGQYALANQIGNQWLICGTLKFLGELQVIQEQYSAAAETFHKVLEIAAQGNQKMKGETLFDLAQVAAAQDNYAEAMRLAFASLEVFESIGQSTAKRVRQWLDELPATKEPKL